MSAQLTLDGREVDVALAVRQSPLRPAQKAILRQARAQGRIRAVEAGLIVHAARDDGRGCTRKQLEAQGFEYLGGYRGVGCCGYCSSDGAAALKRLARRGLVRRADDGQRGWVAT